MKRCLVLLALCSLGLIGCEEGIIDCPGGMCSSIGDPQIDSFPGNRNDDNMQVTPTIPGESGNKQDSSAENGKPVDQPPASEQTPSTEEPPKNEQTPSTEEPPKNEQTPSTEEPPKDPCNNACQPHETCVSGKCQPTCSGDTKLCNGECLTLAAMNMDDCTTCSPNYCNADNNWANGCEKYAMGNDANNCGGCGIKCGSGYSCDKGECVLKCEGGTTKCDGTCVDLASKHMKDCTTCAANYCNADKNWGNGCEINVMGNDVNNCGGCGIKCASGSKCESGTCKSTYNTHRVIVIDAGTLNVRTGPGTGNEKIGELTDYTYVTVTGEKDGWYQFDYKGKTGWISGDYTLDAGDKYSGRKAIDFAETYLYSKNWGLCTYDFLTHDPRITNFTNLDIYGATYNYGYDCNCANFVTASLKSTGLISTNYISVNNLYNACTRGEDGYRKINMADAKPGDIWMNTSLGHTELVLGYKGGTLYLIGSNNFNSSNFTGCAKTTGQSASDYQRVSYGSATSGYVCSRQ